MNEIDKLALLKLARDAIASEFTGIEPATSNAKHLRDPKSVFVTLKKRRNLRGGMGVINNKQPLYDSVMEAAGKAAFEDPRFSQLQEHELEMISIEISVLEDMKLMQGDPEEYVNQIEIGKHGLMIEGEGKAIILPKTAKEKGYTALQFLNALAQAAGLSFSSWRNPENSIYIFRAATFSE